MQGTTSLNVIVLSGHYDHRRKNWYNRQSRRPWLQDLSEQVLGAVNTITSKLAEASFLTVPHN